MKHDYTDVTIQNAIDAACGATAKEHSPTGGALTLNRNAYPSSWISENTARLALARELLERLPHPSQGGTAMSTPIDDTLFAFPSLRMDRPGMTLRDWFAGQAIGGMCASLAPSNGNTPRDLADAAFELADAMLAAREETKQ